MKNTSIQVLALAAFAALPRTAQSGGFQINEHNAAATGRAGAVVATVRDASAVFYNPAGLTQVEGTQVQAGVALIQPSGVYTGVGSAAQPLDAPVTQEAVSNWVPVPNVYLARGLSSKAFVGFGFYAPYGLGIKYEDLDFVGRTVVQELSLRTFFLTPAIALKLSDEISVAVSVSLVPANAYLKRTLGATDNGQVLFPESIYGSEGTVEFAATAFGVGANAGIQATLFEHLKLGLAFRSEVGLDFSGDANFTIPESAPPAVKANFPDGKGTSEITLPHNFSLGVGWEQDAISVEFTTNLTLWQSFDEFRLNFDSGLPAPTSAAPRNWTAVPTFRLGGEYRFLEDYAARLGLAYDVNPIPDTTVDVSLPDQDRFIITVGAGGKWSYFFADVGYMLLLLGERPITADNRNFKGPDGDLGIYESRRIHVIGLTVGVNI